MDNAIKLKQHQVGEFDACIRKQNEIYSIKHGYLPGGTARFYTSLREHILRSGRNACLSMPTSSYEPDSNPHLSDVLHVQSITPARA